MQPWVFLFAAVGLVLGSFGNVLVCRMRSGEDPTGRSHCPSCKKTIHWRDLIPVVSYIALRARCRFCRKKISLQYPAIELGAMAVFLYGAFLHSADPLQAFFVGLSLYWLLLGCTYDFFYQQLPDLFTALFGISVLAHLFVAGELPFIVSHILAAFIPLVWFGSQWALTRGRAVGSGDILLGTVIGFWLGMEVITMLVLSYMIGALIAGALLMTRVVTFQTKRIAFGPFMGMATILTLLGVQDWYLSLLGV